MDFSKGIIPPLKKLFLGPESAPKRSVQSKLKKTVKWETDLQISLFDTNRKLASDPQYPDRRFLLGMYDDFVRDGHLASLIATRKNKALAEGFALFNEAGDIDEKKTELFQKPWFEKFLSYSLDSIFYGHSLIELMNFEKGEFTDCGLIPRDHVRPEYGQIRIDSGSDDPHIKYRKGGFPKLLIEIMKDDRDLGILLNAAKYVIYKRYSQTDWSRNSEKFGMPTIVLRTDETDDDELDKKEEFLANFGSNQWGLFNKQDEVELLEGQQRDPHKIYSEMLNFCNNELSKVILGQTGTTEEKAFVGSAEVHERVLEDYLTADLRKLAFDINFKLFPVLDLWGYPVKGLKFDFLVNRAEEEDDKDDAEGNGPKDPKTPEKGSKKDDPKTEDQKKKLRFNFEEISELYLSPPTCSPSRPE